MSAITALSERRGADMMMEMLSGWRWRGGDAVETVDGLQFTGGFQLVQKTQQQFIGERMMRRRR